jgi:hypothetical protein
LLLDIFVQLYCDHSDKALEDVSGDFATIFATIYLSLEVGLKLVASGIKEAWPGRTGSRIVYLSYTLICAAAVVGMGYAKDLRTEDELKGKRVPLTKALFISKAADAGRLLMRDPKMALMLPTQFAFATMATFFSAFVSPKIVNIVLSNAAVGLFSSVYGAVAAVIAHGGGAFIERTGTHGEFGCMVYSGVWCIRRHVH